MYVHCKLYRNDIYLYSHYLRYIDFIRCHSSLHTFLSAITTSKGLIPEIPPDRNLTTIVLQQFW
jgi:hypothetical protein